MAVEEVDIKFFKSEVVTDTNENGGRRGKEEVVSGVKNNLFPRVTKQEREQGVTRYRKEFFVNLNPNEDTAYGVLLNIIKPSNGEDRFYITAGTQRDTQIDLLNSNPEWVGGGYLAENVSAGATEIKVLFESNDYAIPGNRYLNIKDDNHIEWIPTAEPLYENEVVGTGNGTTTPPLNNVAHPPILKNTLVISSTVGTVVYTVSDDGLGNLTGDGSGTVDYESGAISVTWDNPPDNGSNITANYKQRCYTWEGNVATIRLQSQVANDYNSSNTCVGICIEAGDVKTSHTTPQVNSTNGIFDDEGHPIETKNRGTVEDDWTITFTSATTFMCSGTYEGTVGNGSISNDFAPVNPDTGVPYFIIRKEAWSGSWAEGDTVTFTTHPAAFPIWWKEVVPPGCAREPRNEVDLEWYVE